MKKIIALAIIALTIGGCAASPNTAQKSDSKSLASTTAADSLQTENQTNPSIPVLKDNLIYCNNQKVGKVDGNRIHMLVYGKPVSFDVLDGSATQTVNQISCAFESPQDDVYLGFYYKGLAVSPRLYGPYASYTIDTPTENQKVTYNCDGSLAKLPKSDSGVDWKTYTRNAPYYYCETNSKDYLVQYEFQDKDGYPVMVTGDNPESFWHKIYIKKGSDLNYFFMGLLTSNEQNSSAGIPQISTKTYLDKLLKLPHNAQNISSWQKLVDSFQVDPVGTTI